MLITIFQQCKEEISSQIKLFVKGLLQCCLPKKYIAL